MWRVVAVAAFGLALAIPHPVQAKTFQCGAGDVACLIAAINAANTNGQQHNTIRLDAGTYTLTDINNITDGPNGLPSITSPLTIRGASADTTIMESMGAGRLVHVAASGRLTLRGLTLRGGSVGTSSFGGAIRNQGGRLTLTHVTLNRNVAASGGGLANVGGTVAITETLFTQNFAIFAGGGLANLLPISGPAGSVFITTTTFADNATVPAGGGLWSEGGIVTITQSAFLRNSASVERGGGIRNGGTMFIRNTTLAGNSTGGTGGGLVSVVNATTIVTSSTVVGNTAAGGAGGGGLAGEVILENTLVALNMGVFTPPDDCSGAVTSLGHNLIGDPTGCAITLQPTDLIGDPGLGDFADNGTPGNGHYPLLPSSQAIDAGNKATCPKRDQLGERRVGPCDIGAIEFQDQDDHRHGEDSVATAQEPQ